MGKEAFSSSSITESYIPRLLGVYLELLLLEYLVQPGASYKCLVLKTE